jgi:hypothetical protein
VAKRDAIAMVHDLRRLDALDLAAQGRKRASTCGGA